MLHSKRIIKFALRSVITGGLISKPSVFEDAVYKVYFEDVLCKEVEEDALDKEKELLAFKAVLTKCFGAHNAGGDTKLRYASMVKAVNHRGNCQGFSQLVHSFYQRLRKEFQCMVELAVNSLSESEKEAIGEVPRMEKFSDSQFHMRQKFFLLGKLSTVSVYDALIY